MGESNSRKNYIKRYAKVFFHFTEVLIAFRKRREADVRKSFYPEFFPFFKSIKNCKHCRKLERWMH